MEDQSLLPPVSSSSSVQVSIQLTVRMRGGELLLLDSSAAEAVMRALAAAVPTLEQLLDGLTVQRVQLFACPDARRQGIACLLSPAQLSRGGQPGRAEG